MLELLFFLLQERFQTYKLVLASPEGRAPPAAVSGDAPGRGDELGVVPPPPSASSGLPAALLDHLHFKEIVEKNLFLGRTTDKRQNFPVKP